MITNDFEYEVLTGCPYCGGQEISDSMRANDFLVGSEGEFYLSECRDCHFVFQNPRIKQEYIGKYYGDGLGYYQLPKSYDFKTGLRNKLKKITLVNHFDYPDDKRKIWSKLLTYPMARKLKNELFPHYKKNGQALEIGCGNGTRLKQLSDLGWHIVGEDMNGELALRVQESIGIKVYVEAIEDLNFSNCEFDVVIMSMVLEHLYEPFDQLKKITKWIKSGGALLFSIPYFGGFEFNWFKQHSYGLQLPTHISFFNKRIIREYLQNLGYKKIKFYHHFFDRDVIVSSQYKFNDTKKWYYKLLGWNKFVRLVFIKPIVFILALLGRTSRVSVYAYK